MQEESIDRGIDVNSERITVSDHVRKNLTTLTKWGRIASLGLFVLSGFLVIVAFIFAKNGATSSFYRDSYLMFVIVSLVAALLVFLPGLHLYRSCKNIQRSLKNDDQIDFEVGMDYLKSLFYLLGIYAIVGMFLLLLLIAFFFYIEYILQTMNW